MLRESIPDMPTLMIFLRYCLLCLVFLALPACSRQDSSGSESKPAASRKTVQYSAVADVPEGSRKNAETFARRLEESIRKDDSTEIQIAFNSAAIVDAICEGVTASGLRMNQFKAGMQKGIQKSFTQVGSVWSGQSPKFKGLAIYQGDLATRFRFVSEDGGISVFDLVVRTNRQGRLAIVNFCNHAMGYDLVEQSRQAAIPMLAELDKSFLERVFNKPGMTAAQMKDFGALAEKVRSGDAEGATLIYQGLPDQLRNTMAATGLYIAILQRSGETETYKQGLKDAAARFDSGSFQFMLVDVYAMDKDFAKAAACVDAFMKVVGRDAALLTLKSLMLNAKGDVSAARESLREALEMEPDCIYVHSKGLDVLLAAKDFAAVRDSMLFLEKMGGHDFKGQLTDPLWNEFRKAPESQPWR